jgi:phosphoribosylformylglycinamidine (FGAM) synthase-like enzyme
VDLAAEKRNGDFVRDLIGRGMATAVHDISDGGLAVAIAEMAMASGIGARLEAPVDTAAHAFWFGEDQGRYVVTAKDADARTILGLAAKNSIPLQRLGSTAENALILPGERPILIASLVSRFEGWLPQYMAGNAA